MMKHLFAVATAFTAILCSNPAAYAQEKIHYRAATFLKIAPEKEAEAVEFARTAGVKLTQEAVNSGRMASWSLLHSVYAGVGAEYNYVQVINYDGAPPADLTPEARDQMYRKASGMAYADFQKKLAGFTTSSSSVFSRIDATVQGPPPAVGNYIRVVRWKVTTGRDADYTNYIKKMTQPMVADGAKQGVFLSWSATRVIFPSGEDVPFDATTSFTYKDMASVVPSTPAVPGQGAPASFAKVFPDQTYSSYVDEGRQLRHQVRQELLRVVAATGPAAR